MKRTAKKHNFKERNQNLSNSESANRHKVVTNNINYLKVEKTKEFMIIFRHAPMADFQMSPEEMQANIKQWQDWIGGIAAQGKFIGTNQLGFEGKTLKPNNVITDGPYAEVKEIVGGYVLVKAKSLDEAIALAEDCPILFIGGHVEVRDIMKLN